MKEEAQLSPPENGARHAPRLETRHRGVHERCGVHGPPKGLGALTCKDHVLDNCKDERRNHAGEDGADDEGGDNRAKAVLASNSAVLGCDDVAPFDARTRGNADTDQRANERVRA